jgi:hypothetical protein
LTPSLNACKARADQIALNRNIHLSFSLTLRPADPLEDGKPSQEWDILIDNVSGKEILHSSETLEEAALVVSFVAERSRSRLCVQDGAGNSRFGTSLASLTPEVENPNTRALRNILPLTASNHGRLELVSRIRARSEAT